MTCRRLWEEWLSPEAFFANFHRHLEVMDLPDRNRKRLPPHHPYTLCVRQSAEESGGDRPTAFQKVGWDADSPGRGPRRSGVKTTRAYQSWAFPEAL